MSSTPDNKRNHDNVCPIPEFVEANNKAIRNAEDYNVRDQIGWEALRHLKKALPLGIPNHSLSINEHPNNTWLKTTRFFNSYREKLFQNSQHLDLAGKRNKLTTFIANLQKYEHDDFEGSFVLDSACMEILPAIIAQMFQDYFVGELPAAQNLTDYQMRNEIATIFGVGTLEQQNYVVLNYLLHQTQDKKEFYPITFYYPGIALPTHSLAQYLEAWRSFCVITVGGEQGARNSKTWDYGSIVYIDCLNKTVYSAERILKELPASIIPHLSIEKQKRQIIFTEPVKVEDLKISKEKFGVSREEVDLWLKETYRRIVGLELPQKFYLKKLHNKELAEQRIVESSTTELEVEGMNRTAGSGSTTTVSQVTAGGNIGAQVEPLLLSGALTQNAATDTSTLSSVATNASTLANSSADGRPAQSSSIITPI